MFILTGFVVETWLYMAIAFVAGAALGLVVRRVNRISEHSHATTENNFDLDALRAQQARTLEELQSRIANVQAQRNKAQSERERLMKGLAEISGGAKDGVTIALASAHELARRARELGEHEGNLASHDAELKQLHEELTAAQQLIEEVDAQRNALDQQVHEQSAELWKLRAEIEATQRKSHEQRARTMMLTRSNVRKTEIVANRLEDQLKHWVRKTGPIAVNWSEHGHASVVQEQFERLDREFIDRYFSHATNPEYERGQHRMIRVHSATDPNGVEYGELLIALDDDAGRTLGLRFELKKGAPEAKAVGFVLAMYLRALTRDFRDYGILVK
jgi:small-conductance mechanosensitive channel